MLRSSTGEGKQPSTLRPADKGGLKKTGGRKQRAEGVEWQ